MVLSLPSLSCDIVGKLAGRILGGFGGFVDSKVIPRRLNDKHSIELSERAVRYHLGLLDGRGHTLQL